MNGHDRMIRLLNVKPRGYLAVIGGAEVPTPTVPHVARALRPETLAKFEKTAKAMAKRWGAAATSSLLAELEPLAEHDDGLIIVQTFGALAWVEAGRGMMRPLILTPWFVIGDTWQRLSPVKGLQALMREAPDACLSQPLETLAALCAATHAHLYTTPSKLRAAHPDASPELLALARPPTAEGRELHALAFFEGGVGPLTLNVDTAEATLDARLDLPWRPMVLK